MFNLQNIFKYIFTFLFFKKKNIFKILRDPVHDVKNTVQQRDLEHKQSLMNIYSLEILDQRYEEPWKNVKEKME